MEFQRLCKASVWSLLGVLAGMVCICRGAAEDSVTIKPKEELRAIAKVPGAEAKKLPEWDKVVEGAKRMEGLFPLYYNEKEQKLFMEVQQAQYDKEVILPMAIARARASCISAGRR